MLATSFRPVGYSLIPMDVREAFCYRQPMAKPHYISLALALFGLGFLFTRLTHEQSPAPSAVSLPAVTEEQLAAAYERITLFDLPAIEKFFTSRGIVFVYRSDCTQCDAQWRELAKLPRDMPLLALSADDTPDTFARALASRSSDASPTPYYIPPGRVLGLRSWLREHGCRFAGPLPFIALTDGKGRCAMAWQGLTAHTAIEGVLAYLASPPAPPK